MKCLWRVETLGDQWKNRHTGSEKQEASACAAEWKPSTISSRSSGKPGPRGGARPAGEETWACVKPEHTAVERCEVTAPNQEHAVKPASQSPRYKKPSPSARGGHRSRLKAGSALEGNTAGGSRDTPSSINYGFAGPC